jgi:hypothetical protein
MAVFAPIAPPYSLKLQLKPLLSMQSSTLRGVGGAVVLA